MKARMYSEAAAEYFDLRQRAPETGTAMKEHMPLMVAHRQALPKRLPPAIVQPQETLSPVQTRERDVLLNVTPAPTTGHFLPEQQQQEEMDSLEAPAFQEKEQMRAYHPLERTQSFSLHQPKEEELQKAHSVEELAGSSGMREQQMPQAVAFSVVPDVKDMFAHLAPKNKAQQERMNKIYEAMKGKERIVTYDPNTYEVILHKNQRIPKSNLFKILHYVSSFKPVADKEPKGVDNFLGALGLAGMSSDLISSTKLKPFVEGVRPQPSSGQFGTGFTKIKWIKLF